MRRRSAQFGLTILFLASLACTPFKAIPDAGLDATSLDAPTLDAPQGSDGAGGMAGDGSGGGGGVAGSPGMGGQTGVGGGTGQICLPTEHNCVGSCVDNNSPAHCGGLCDPCVPPAGGEATCNQGKCDFSCGSMKKCASKCTSGCCVDTDCLTQAGMAGQCDTSTNTCNYACAAGFKPCGAGNCIPAASCCVQSDCPGTCKTCSANGVCATVTNAEDPDSCPGVCDGVGACKSKQGQTCQTGAGCVSGSTCAPDGYCCNTACSNSCQACDLAGFLGICTPVASGSPHGNRVACAGAGATCGGSCGNKADGSCAYPVIACSVPQSCVGGTKSTAAVCDGTGLCSAPVRTACPGGCNAAGTDCLSCGAGLAACNGVCCQSGQGCCGGACVDTTSNPRLCGNSCTVCPTPARAVATCAAGQCGGSCIAGAPTCSDGSCSRLSWTFDSMDLDGIVASGSGSPPVAIRNFNGNPALGVDIVMTGTMFQSVNFVIPICLSGTVDLHAKTLTMHVFFDGTPAYPADSEQFYVGVVQGNQSLAFQSVPSGVWITTTAPFSLSTSSATTSTVFVDAGSFGGAFAGTVWFDDITIQ
jgi:hypothetical protein